MNRVSWIFKFTDYNYLTINILNKKSLNNCKSYDEFIEKLFYIICFMI